MLTGELYIDAHTLVPIAFDGSIENIQIQQIGGNKDSYAFSPFAPKIAFNIGFKTDSLSVNINHICVSFNYKDLTCKSFVLNADSSYLGYPSKPLRENLLDAIEHTKTRADLFSKEVFVFHTKEEDSVVDNMDNWAMNNNSMVSSTRLDSLTQRLRLFGERIPQEKVYVHLDNTSYFLGGRVIMKGSKWDKILFDGGYCQATPVGSSDYTFAFYYYNQDHLGNIREVVDATGCGDTYSAGYLYCRAKGMDYAESGRFAAAMCTLKLEHTGPFDKTIDDIYAYFRKY